MRSKADTHSEEAEKAVRDIRRATRRLYSAEEKVRIVIAGLRGEDSVAELCRKEGINQNLYYRWSKDFLEAGKKRLAGDTAGFRAVPGCAAPTPSVREGFSYDLGKRRNPRLNPLTQCAKANLLPPSAPEVGAAPEVEANDICEPFRIARLARAGA